MRLLMSGGGTAGHVFPCIAVADTLRHEDPHRHTFLFVGHSWGMERDLVRRSGYEFRGISLRGGIRGKNPMAALAAAGGMIAGFAQCLGIIRGFRPQAILATGGYASVPPILAGWFLRVPIVLYLPDLSPGWAVRAMQPFARRIAVTCPEAARYFPQGKVVVTGYPVRPSLFEQDREAARQAFGLDPAQRTLLVMGGSRGARSINMAVSQGLAQLLTICQIIHVSGHNDAASLRQQREELPEALRQRYRLYPFLHEDMSKALTAADLVVTRAGASVLGELPAVGVPAILIPYTGGHRDQEENAAYMERHGAAVVLHDHSLSAQTLVDAVGGLFNNPERLERLRAGVQALAQPDAARHLGRELIQISVPRGDV